MKVEILNCNCPKMCENAVNAVVARTYTVKAEEPPTILHGQNL